jgi:hypothetical protein
LDLLERRDFRDAAFERFVPRRAAFEAGVLPPPPNALPPRLELPRDFLEYRLPRALLLMELICKFIILADLEIR